MWVGMNKCCGRRRSLLQAVLLLVGVCLFAAVGCERSKTSQTRQPVTLGAVLTRMSDPKYFGVPLEARAGMVSTCDRTGRNMDWANWGQGQSLDGNYTLANIEGPGCLTRIWTTGYGGGEWQIYVDDDLQPRISGKVWDMFGAKEPGVPPLADQISSAAHTYLPVPFAGRVRVVVSAQKIPAEARPYYQIGYEVYPKGTPVTPYPLVLQESDRNNFAALRKAWDGVEGAVRDEVLSASWHEVIARPGATCSMEEIKGAGTIQTLAVRLKGLEGLPVVERPRVLRNLVLQCWWDDAANPSVDVPFGDFFCNGLAFRSFASMPLANLDNTFVCRFPMQFRTKGSIRIRNDGRFPVTIQSWTRRTPATDKPADASYFHASWNSVMSPGVPFRVMAAEGNGQYVGCYLTTYGMDGSWNILEGNEYIYVDGEKAPSWCGTGVEDYFNGGWYYVGLYERPLYGLLEKAAMRTSQYRFHLSDPVGFRKSIRMDLEFGVANRAQGYMSAVGYWYQDRPCSANSAVPPADQRFPPFDRVAFSAVMSELFELEKAGLVRDAEARCRYYEALFAANAYGPMYGLRALAYREVLEGSLAVRPLYAALASRTDVPAEVAAQARVLHWFGDAPNRALLGAHAGGAWRLYWDRRLVGEGDKPSEFKVFPLELTPGEHWIMAEVTPRSPSSFFSASLRTAYTNITTDTQWEYMSRKPEGWPGAGGAEWKPVDPQLSMFPQMNWWQFVPNGFVGMQQGWQIIQPYPAWSQVPGRPVYLRRRVVLPVDGAGPFVLLPRQKEMRLSPIRPAGDTSNEGLKR